MESAATARDLVWKYQILTMRRMLMANNGEQLHHWGPSFASLYREFIESLLPDQQSSDPFIEWAFLVYHACRARLLLLPTDLHRKYFDIYSSDDYSKFTMCRLGDRFFVVPLQYFDQRPREIYFIPIPDVTIMPHQWPFKRGSVGDCVMSAIMSR